LQFKGPSAWEDESGEKKALNDQIFLEHERHHAEMMDLLKRNKSGGPLPTSSASGMAGR